MATEFQTALLAEIEEAILAIVSGKVQSHSIGKMSYSLHNIDSLYRLHREVTASADTSGSMRINTAIMRRR